MSPIWGVICHLLLVVGVALLFVLGLVVRVALKIQIFNKNKINKKIQKYNILRCKSGKRAGPRFQMAKNIIV